MRVCEPFFRNGFLMDTLNLDKAIAVTRNIQMLEIENVGKTKAKKITPSIISLLEKQSHVCHPPL